MRITLPTTHLIEMVSNEHKAFCQTLVSGFDVGSSAIFCLYIMYVSPNQQKFMDLAFYVSCIVFALYVILIPESPRWLFLKNPHSKEGRDVLNYIAWFNGSKRRLAADALMDNLGQLSKDIGQ